MAKCLAMILAGGDPSLVGRCRELFSFFGLNVIHVGNIGDATKMKFIVNLVQGELMVALAESIVLGEKLGFNADKILEVLDSGGVASPLFHSKGRTIARGDFSALLSGGFGWGELYIFGCVASWVAYSLLGKAVMSSLSPLAAVTYSSVAGTVCLLPAAMMENLGGAAAYPFDAWVSILYLGFFGTVLGFIWYYQGIQRIGPVRAGLFINFVPVFALLLAFIILKEPVTPSLLIGAVFVSSGVYLTTLGSRRA